MRGRRELLVVLASVARSGCAWSIGSRPAAPCPKPTPPAGTTITLTCTTGDAFILSTGTDTGRCSSTVDEDGIASASCDDGQGNTASAECFSIAGPGSCVSTTGKGSCLKK